MAVRTWSFYGWTVQTVWLPRITERECTSGLAESCNLVCRPGDRPPACFAWPKYVAAFRLRLGQALTAVP